MSTKPNFSEGYSHTARLAAERAQRLTEGGFEKEAKAWEGIRGYCESMSDKNLLDDEKSGVKTGHVREPHEISNDHEMLEYRETHKHLPKPHRSRKSDIAWKVQPEPKDSQRAMWEEVATELALSKLPPQQRECFELTMPIVTLEWEKGELKEKFSYSITYDEAAEILSQVRGRPMKSNEVRARVSNARKKIEEIRRLVDPIFRRYRRPKEELVKVGKGWYLAKVSSTGELIIPQDILTGSEQDEAVRPTST